MRAALALAACFLVLLIGGGARFAIGLTFKPMVDEFGWARGELGLAVGLYMVVSAVRDLHRGPHGRPVQSARAADRRHGRSAALGIGADEPRVAAVARARALRRRVRDRQRRGLAGDRRRDRDAHLSGPRGPRQRGRDLRHERRAARDDRGAGSRAGADRLALGIRLDRHRASCCCCRCCSRCRGRAARSGKRGAARLSLREAARTRQFWLLLAVYAICGLDDFFVTTHVAAFAQDRGLTPLSPETCWR